MLEYVLQVQQINKCKNLKQLHLFLIILYIYRFKAKLR